MSVEITIDREACMGSGNCAFWAPGVFDLDDDGIAIVIDPNGGEQEKIVLAAQGCPTQAISVVADGAEIHYSLGIRQAEKLPLVFDPS